MRLPRRTRKKARIEIIPMIDTMFFLLVFFMIATLTMTVQRGLQVNLPHAATAKDNIKQVVTLTLTKDGKLYFDKDEVGSVSHVQSRLVSKENRASEISIIINADRAVEHGRVIEVMDAVRKVCTAKIAVAVRPVTLNQ
ncbi:MAG TPA: biopolymer transporter ExbD [Syntrophorhabdaceae bacterium]|nr:MAG: Biopolymer transport protein ExbD [Deltaproteobacteria bacterium ADurb.Bin135]HNQ63127.1 biopolymer transporter ExbD [Syntrophorhabdaceae bacterium]HNZ58917.1 biopolymer transporter ExbD [Syntrophorhabdaceae bacterium]HOB69041.1 biopolymer transporter ExbD [Syntrophorhabdaceae bacterium]HOG40005.1 biopolymer transporter ExbD [Syntrophorhabdaceae bacterium]